MKKGLVLEGGAMRGMFTAGVLDVFMENGIEFDGAIGVSAGATFGCNIKSRQIGRVIRYNKHFAKDARYCSVKSLLLTGDLYNADFCYNKLVHELDVWDESTFANNPMEFYCVAADANTAEPLYHKCNQGGENDLLWIRGSASMPMVSRPVKVDGYELLDGGISDSVPYRYFTSIGYDRNVVVLTQPMTYRKKQFSKKMQRVMKAALRKKPAVYEKLMNRYQAYNEEIRDICEEESRGNCFVIRPDESLHIGSVCHDPEELQRVYETGRMTALRCLDRLKDYLYEK